jgi:hypothetical protein
MNEPFFPLPIPRGPENGLAALVSAVLRRVRRPGPGPVCRESRLAVRRPRRRESGVGRPPFPVLPPPAV